MNLYTVFGCDVSSRVSPILHTTHPEKLAGFITLSSTVSIYYLVLDCPVNYRRVVQLFYDDMRMRTEVGVHSSRAGPLIRLISQKVVPVTTGAALFSGFKGTSV